MNKDDIRKENNIKIVKINYFDSKNIEEPPKAEDFYHLHYSLQKCSFQPDSTVEKYIIDNQLYNKDHKSSKNMIYLKSQNDEYFSINDDNYERIKFKLDLDKKLPNHEVVKKIKI